MNKFQRFIYLTLVITMLSCTSTPPAGENVNPQYLIEGRDYTFAIYNNANQLITFPVEDWLNRSKEMDDKGKPYTDVFVVSHGWNFTITEAISNYYSYIKTIEANKANSNSEEFRPYFIFVVWQSVSRPLTDATRSILPYGIADFVKPLVSTIDEIVFHIPSGWKESINAYHNALGHDLPVTYLENEDSRKQEYNEDKGGRDLPVSEVLYDIFSENIKRKANKPRIHIIGHSYGAKLITLATIAALHKYEIKTKIRPDNFLESIILFNAAFHPLELDYVFSESSWFFPFDSVERYFKTIPRKAIVFSNSDYATGFLYGLGQIILNGKQAQMVDSLLEHETGNEGGMRFLPEWFRTYVGKPISAGLQLPWNVGTSALEWSLRTTVQLPTEWWYHVQNNDTFGNNLFSKVFNSVHFFVPVDKLLNEDVDHQGIFRTTLPALGRSGLHNNVKGHFEIDSDFPIDLGAFKNFVYDEKGNQRPTTEINSNTFAKMACKTNWSRGSNFHDPNLMYSFDASAVFDTLKSPSGSHGDLRSHEEITYCVQNGLSDKAPQKVNGTLNFVIKFIHGFNGL